MKATEYKYLKLPLSWFEILEKLADKVESDLEKEEKTPMSVYKLVGHCSSIKFLKQYAEDFEVNF